MSQPDPPPFAVPPLESVRWSADGTALRIIDQTALPEREVYVELRELDEIVCAIRELKVRGAPAIGVAGAVGLVVSLEHVTGDDGLRAKSLLALHAKRLVEARPTAVNLAWALARMLAATTASDSTTLLRDLRVEATNILDEDITLCRRIGEIGAQLLHDGSRVLTHCNAGSLATAGIGTALAPLYVACERGLIVHVFAGETRPLRQGARLTAWELARAQIDVTVLPDSAAASLLRDGSIDLVIVGADRIAANGDFANKVGTYPLALAARAHGVPLYVAAPYSTFDLATAMGEGIVIEQRSASELEPLPVNAKVYNPAFDVTPWHLVSGYITDRGLLHAPFSRHNVLAELSPSSTTQT